MTLLAVISTPFCIDNDISWKKGSRPGVILRVPLAMFYIN